MKRIAITGAHGTIGKILLKYLQKDYLIAPLSRPEVDVSDYDVLKRKTINQDVLIHLAQAREVGFNNENFNIKDFQSAYNVYKVAIENKIPRVIIASSIHSDDYSQLKSSELKKPYSLPNPDSPYGALKVYVEALGRYFATKRLEVICIRFGGINSDDNPNLDEPGYKSIYLSHADCIALIRRCIEIPKIPNRYELLYAVSNNKPLLHNWVNSLDWIPQDSSTL